MAFKSILLTCGLQVGCVRTAALGSHGCNPGEGWELESNGSSGGIEEWLGFGYSLREEHVRFADRLEIGQDRKRRAKNESQVLASASGGMEVEEWRK